MLDINNRNRQSTRFARTASRAVAVALACGVLASASGCLISSRNSTELSGAYVGSGTFQQIEPGVTTEQWLVAAMGQPTDRSTLDDGRELWAWRYSRRVKSRGAVFLIAGGSSDKMSQGGVFVELRDGVVCKTWRD